jgi:nitrogen regulatory protein PII
MKPVKRIDIVIRAAHLDRVLDALASVGVTAYTITEQVTGRGNRGHQPGDDLSGVFTNTCIMVAVEPDQLQPIAQVLRPILHEAGGVCLASDAQWLIH